MKAPLLLKQIEEQPYSYLAERSIHCLKAFVDGYAHGVSDFTELDNFLGDFHAWIKSHFGITSSQSWDKIILFYSADRFYAFVNTFKLIDEFLTESQNKSDKHAPQVPLENAYETCFVDEFNVDSPELTTQGGGVETQDAGIENNRKNITATSMIIPDLLNQIRLRPGLYLEETSVTCLKGFLDGATPGNVEIAEFINSFHEWIQKRFEILSSQSWSKIITFFSQDEFDAFHRAFELMDEFISGQSGRP